MAEKGKIVVKKWDFRGKKWDFRGKKWVFGGWKIRAGNQTRKAKWCKTQLLCLKLDKTKDMKC